MRVVVVSFWSTFTLSCSICVAYQNVYEKPLEILTLRHNGSEKLAVRHARQAADSDCTNTSFAPCVNTAKYRTIDGSCNNLGNPRWGMAGIAQNRLVNPAYDDELDVPRGGREASRLPNVRSLSMTFKKNGDLVFPPYSNMVPQFGQFLGHDITMTAEQGLNCCPEGKFSNCWPMPVPSTDDLRGCMNFVRSTSCKSGQSGSRREQMNKNTAYIDGSMIYGSTEERAKKLRTMQGGRLVTSNEPDFNGFLPSANQLEEQSVGKFLAGDDRVNVQPGLSVMHNLFLKEHNRLADAIKQTRPNLDDETIYQEARRINAAQIQQITYSEYLPAILGPNTMQRYGLLLPPPGHYSNYDPNVDASIINSFATAAFRFGHTLVSERVHLISHVNQNMGSYLIKDEYFQDRKITQSKGQGYDWTLRGLSVTPCQFFDPKVTAGVSNFLFSTNGTDLGSDLLARNIQRGRDHGLPSYNVFRNLCGLPAVTFGRQPLEINPLNRQSLQKQYANADDIDLFVGGTHETPIPGGASGPTFNCIKARQFSRLKQGDRFFFSHGGQTGSFTPAQILEIRRVTLSDVVCKNSQQPDAPKNAFFLPSSSNPVVPCNHPSRRALINMNIFV